MGGKYLPRRLLLDGRGRKGFVTIVEVFLDDSDKVSSAWKIDDVYRWYLVVVACLRMREQRCDKQEVGGWLVRVWQNAGTKFNSLYMACNYR